MVTEMSFAGMTLYQVVWYFLMYSLVGWMVEVSYHAVTMGKVINRGFLAGPVCPVYGFGMIAVFGVIDTIAGTGVSRIAEVNAGLVFLCGMVLASAVEFIAGWGLYHAFHARWWDYRKKPFNISGYICLEFSIYWGIGALLVVRVLHPLVDGVSAGLVPPKWGWPLAAVLYAVYLADFIVTVMIVLGLNRHLAELDDLRASMRIVSDDLSERIGTGTLDSMQRIDEGRVRAALVRAELRDAVEEQRVKTERELAKRRAEAELYNEQLRESAEAFLADARDAAMEAARDAKGVVQDTRDVVKDAGEAARDAAMDAVRDAKDTVLEAKDAAREAREARAKELRAALSKGRFFGPGRLLRAFPELTYDSRTYDAIMQEVREEIFGKTQEQDG